jgi:hypothetical protein
VKKRSVIKAKEAERLVAPPKIRLEQEQKKRSREMKENFAWRRKLVCCVGEFFCERMRKKRRSKLFGWSVFVRDAGWAAMQCWNQKFFAMQCKITKIEQTNLFMINIKIQLLNEH